MDKSSVDITPVSAINTYTCTSVFRYERLNETWKFQRWKEHKTRWTSYWVWMCSVSLHAHALSVLPPCSWPLSEVVYFPLCYWLPHSLPPFLPPFCPHFPLQFLWKQWCHGIMQNCASMMSFIHLAALFTHYRGLNAPCNMTVLLNV